MNTEVWFAFFLATCLISMTPGAGALICINHGLIFGVRKTLFTIAGLEIGSLVIFLLTSIGLGTIILASEVIFVAIKTIGAIYLIYLGINQWIESVRLTDLVKTEPPSTNRNNYYLFLIGIMTNLTNPKGIIFMSAMLPQFINPSESLQPQLLTLSITMISVDIIVMCTYSLLAIRMKELLRSPKTLRLQNRIVGTLLIAIGMTLFVVKRPSL